LLLGEHMAFGKLGAMGRGMGHLGDLGRPGNQFTPDAIVFEGDTYFQRGAALTGAAASRTGWVSFWYQPIANDANSHTIFASSSSRILVQRDVANKIRVTLTDGTNTLAFRTATTIVNGAAMSHFCASWDTNAAAGARTFQMYRDGASDVETLTDTGVAFNIPYNLTNWAFGSIVGGGGNFASGVLKEFLFNAGESVNWASNIGRVYSSGRPVDPGPAGALVSGSTPLVYATARSGEAATAFKVNRGSGGNFSLTAGAEILASLPLIAYGDSLVFGTGASSNPNTAWHKQVCRAASPARRRMNFGVGGETASAIATRFNAAIAGHVSNFPNAIYIIDGGYNDIGSAITNGSTPTINALKSMVDALLAAQPSAKYILMGIPLGSAYRSGSAGFTVAGEMDAAMSAYCGANFFDWRDYLVTNGLTAAGVTPTAQDNTDVADLIVPESLRAAADVVHHDDDGHLADKVGILAKLQALGYVS
jgi:hypothetical protein